jgi:hypothetical protein
MRRLVSLVIAIALLAGFSGGAPVNAKTARPKVTLRAFVRALLPDASNNFTSFRGAKYDSDTYYVQYVVHPKSGTGPCSKCKIYDQYGRGTYKENWYLQDGWNSTWTVPKTESWVKAQLGPLLSGFSLHRTVKYSYPTLVWRNPRNVWVYADFYSKGFTLRVGHDLTKSAHVLLPPSKAQLADLRSASANIIRLAVPASSDNFTSLRSSATKKNIFSGLDYGVTASFGSMFRPCTISNIASGFGYKDFQPKWSMNCRTITMAGTKADLEETVRSAVWNALPSAFTAVTDPSVLFLDDYRWDDSGGAVSASISSFEDHGVVSFEVWVTHFLPKP